jgi:hypothetical protein
VADLFWLIGCHGDAEKENGPYMSPADRTSINCSLRSALTVERRIARPLWNENERERIIAVKAYEVFCLRGCEHGSDLNDWLSAEREFASEADDVVVTQSAKGFDISIADRGQERMVLSISPSSLLVLWTGAGTDSSEQETAMPPSTVSLASLPEPTDPATAEVSYREGRVRLFLPVVGDGLPPTEPDNL